MASTFFTGLGDINIAKEVIAQQPDLYIQKREYSGTGVYAIESTGGGTSILTPATSPSWTAGEFASTVANNLLITDDNGLVVAGKIVGNDEESIFFDESAMLQENDETTAASFTAGNSYTFKVYSPSSDTGNTYGPFFGLVEGAELNITDTFMKYKQGVPKKLLFKDLEEREAQITGGQVSFSNSDVAKAIFGAVEYGSQTGQTSLAVGSDPDTNVFYRATFVGKDRANRVWVVRMRENQFEINGNMFNKAESGHFMAGFTADLISDAMYPDNADLLQIVRTD